MHWYRQTGKTILLAQHSERDDDSAQGRWADGFNVTRKKASKNNALV